MKTPFALIIILICFTILYPLQKSIDKVRPPEDIVERELYLSSGNVVKRLAFGFEGSLADAYWMRSIQYYGKQLLDENGEIDYGQLSQINYDLLYPLLDITTTLDPKYFEAYRFGGIFLVDPKYAQALQILKKGIDNNPTDWRLYQCLAIAYWRKNDYKNASEVFMKGGEQPQAPYWMKILGGVMLTQGGERQVACQIYANLYEEAKNSNDNLVMGQMEMQLRRLASLDEIDYMNQIVAQYREATGKCPDSISALVPTLRLPANRVGTCGQPIAIKFNAKNEPLSYIDEPYIFDVKECKVKMPFDLAHP